MWSLIPPAEWIENETQLAEMGQYLYNAGLQNGEGIGYDTETTGLRIDYDTPVMMSFSDGLRRFAMMASWLHHPWVKDALLENPAIPKIMSNAKFDMHMSANAGVNLQGDCIDTVVESWLHNENRYEHKLKVTARDFCGIQMIDFKEIFPMKKATKSTPAESPGEAIYRTLADYDGGGRQRAIEYSGLDPYASFKVHEFLKTKLLQESAFPGWSMWDHYKTWEVPFTRVLYNCERRGFSICTGHLKSQMQPMEKFMTSMEDQITAMAGRYINLNSPAQLGKLFFEQLGYTPIKWTKGGKTGIKSPSTDEETLTAYADKGCPYSKLILQHRTYAKIYGTYIEGMLKWVDKDLRIHTSLKQGGTVTGRLSSSEPNLQNLPRAKGDKFGIRQAFVAPPGKVLVVADYDQLEMKLMAHFSGDTAMCEAIMQGKDLHCYTVSLMFGEDYDEVVIAKKTKSDQLTPKQEILVGMRQSAKATGFGLIYGIGPLKLSVQLTEELKRLVDLNEAKLSIRKYFGVFPGVEAFIKGTHVVCQQTEYVQTILGRKRRLPQINARGSGSSGDEDGKGVVAEAKRQSVNSIIQGTAADVAKASMLRAEHDPVLLSLGAQLLMQIHDELIFEVDDDPDIYEPVKKRVKEIMEAPFGESFKLNVPLTTEAHHGYTWAESK